MWWFNSLFHGSMSSTVILKFKNMFKARWPTFLSTKGLKMFQFYWNTSGWTICKHPTSNVYIRCLFKFHFKFQISNLHLFLFRSIFCSRIALLLFRVFVWRFFDFDLSKKLRRHSFTDVFTVFNVAFQCTSICGDLF